MIPKWSSPPRSLPFPGPLGSIATTSKKRWQEQKPTRSSPKISPAISLGSAAKRSPNCCPSPRLPGRQSREAVKPLAAKAIFAADAFLGRHPRLPTIALVATLAVALAVAIPLRSKQLFADPGLVAHEWGTFTAIAGSDGQPVDWLPVDLVGPPELPRFVEHFRGEPKDVLRGTVRMETPVIYFYAGQETSVSVHVSFSKGFITEWYPHETRLQPSTPLSSEALYQQHDDGSIAWDSITVAPNLAPDFPREKGASRYYAARETSATPLSVKAPTGDQHEKFLFYRGVSPISLPFSAKVLPSGAIVFDNRGGQ